MSSPNNKNLTHGDKTQSQQNVTSQLNKSHRIEGKNKKSLHQKQQQQKHEAVGKQQNSTSKQQQTSNSAGSNRNNRSTNKNSSTPQIAVGSKPGNNSVDVGSTLDQFSKRAQELKSEINEALEKQARHQQDADQSVEVVKLKDDIIQLAGLQDDAENQTVATNEGQQGCSNVNTAADVKLSSQDNPANITVDKVKSSDSTREEKKEVVRCKPMNGLNQSLSKLSVNDEINSTDSKTTARSKLKKQDTHNCVPRQAQDRTSNDEFELLEAKLDAESKCVALVSSLQRRFEGSTPTELLNSICHKLVNLSEQNEQLVDENQKLTNVKQKLENICRELQKSNNAIRIESLDLIKAEQSKAKDQTTKIQSTLSGVVSLFDENQKRNMSLRQENSELQTKLKSLLDHCDSWEKSVEAALRQREIENRLLKTELAKESLLKNEEKEKFLVEKQELLKILSMMQEQQHRIEGQEKKLRSDLSSYANKYDECQAVINKGMSRFKEESTKMLQEIQKWREDYKNLLAKYEASKLAWDKAMGQKNKKIETLEKLCRALSERKLDAGNTSNMTTSSPANTGTDSSNNSAA